ncbi:MAG: 50S ribosomal protein L31, partial [Deferribacterales bacterium]|nr:50S ribosomal protein L31 [Deferribacterales bacterium]
MLVEKSCVDIFYKRSRDMKEGIHPEYKEVIFKCACGNEIV